MTALATISSASWIGALAPNGNVGAVSISVGQATIDSKTKPIYTLNLSGNYYYNNGVMFGASFSLGYTENPDTEVSTKAMGELNGKFRLGYSFGKLARGFGVYGIADYSYLMYNRSYINSITSEYEDETANAGGIGFGGGAEYRFDSNWLVTASYTTTTMSPDKGADFDYDKALFSVGYTW